MLLTPEESIQIQVGIIFDFSNNLLVEIIIMFHNYHAENRAHKRQTWLFEQLWKCTQVVRKYRIHNAKTVYLSVSFNGSNIIIKWMSQSKHMCTTPPIWIGIQVEYLMDI